MRLQWADTAHEDLFRIADFLDTEEIGSGNAMLEAVLAATGLLAQHPQIGPAIMGSRIRKWPVTGHPFLLLYEVGPRQISIVRFVHNRSDWQSLL